MFSFKANYLTIEFSQVDVTLVHVFPYKSHEGNLQSTSAKLRIKVSDLHVGDNGVLEISCRSTIPSFPMHNKQFADLKSKTIPGKFGCSVMSQSQDIHLFFQVGNIIIIVWILKMFQDLLRCLEMSSNISYARNGFIDVF